MSHTHTHTCTHMHTHMHTHAHTHAHTCTHTCTHTATHTQTHTCTHTATHTDTHRDRHSYIKGTVLTRPAPRLARAVCGRSTVYWHLLLLAIRCSIYNINGRISPSIMKLAICAIYQIVRLVHSNILSYHRRLYVQYPLSNRPVKVTDLEHRGRGLVTRCPVFD